MKGENLGEGKNLSKYKINKLQHGKCFDGIYALVGLVLENALVGYAHSLVFSGINS